MQTFLIGLVSGVLLAGVVLFAWLCFEEWDEQRQLEQAGD